jgi:riboflavin kinase/FMN adenylyltransferase
MKIFTNYKSVAEHTKDSILLLGNFDGVHRGHQKIINSAKKIQSKKNKKVGVLLFDPHPKIFFKKEKRNFLLTQIDKRCEILKNYGVDYVIILKFSSSVAKMTPHYFCSKILRDGIQMKYIFVGKNFKFGTNRSGDYKYLKDFGMKNDFLVSPVSIFKLPVSLAKYFKKKIFSSSNVRLAIEDGKIKLANKILGRSWFIFGKVIKGDQRGRLIGFPTANIEIEGYSQPNYGVYAVTVKIINKSKRNMDYKGIANFGIRPTFNKKKPLLEVYLFDFNLNIYNSTLKVNFIDFIRNEKKFSGIDSLKIQLNKDILKAKQILR